MKNCHWTLSWFDRSGLACRLRLAAARLLLMMVFSISTNALAAIGDSCSLVPVTTLGGAYVNSKNEYILTDDVNNQSGFIWSNGQIDLGDPFDISLGVYLGSNAGVNSSGFDIGADGLAFVLQNDPRGVAAQGYIGGFMGVDGDINLSAYGMPNRAVYPSLTVEFDTFDNSYMGFTGDIASDHTGIYLNGDVALPDAANTLQSATAVGAGGEIEDGQYHLARYVWNPVTQYFTYYFDGQQMASVKYDLIKYFGSPYVRFGFAAATGASKNLQKTCWVVPPVMYNPAWERSDSPASYGEALHRVVPGMKLGVGIDTETTAISSADAAADGADDDGIVLPVLAQGGSASMTAQVSGAGGYLQAWVDWNGDGDFADAGEQVATNLQDNLAGDTDNTTGSIEFQVNVPADAAASTFARFRWSSSLGLDATTKANDGEVEDYPLAILPSAFSCSGQALMMRGTTTNALFSLSAANGSVSATALGVARPLVNAIGYRASHHYLYGIRTSDRYLMLIGANGEQRALGAVSGLPAGSYYSGSFGPDGFLYVRGTTGAMIKINVDTLTATTTTITSTQNIPDFAIHPTDGYAYGVVANGRPAKFPMAGGAAVLFGTSTAKTFGSVFTDATGAVYLIESSTSDIYQLNTATGSIALVGDSNPNVSGTANSADASFCSDAVFALPQDYSDIPLSATQYGPAQHSVVAGIRLGAANTADISVYDSLTASADSGDDGLSIPPLVQGETVTLTAKVSGTGGYLQGWIDWNGDGDFTDAGEQVATDLQDNLTGDTSSTTGTIAFSVTVPVTAATSTLDGFARFRWSTTAGLNATDPAINGEVEDYAITLRPVPVNCPTLVTGESMGTFGTINATQKYRNLENPVPGYTYKIPKNLSAGEYVVTSQAYRSTTWNSLGLNIAGHTTGSVDDAFLLVNGSTSQGTFYQQTIPVQPNSDLEVSVWVRNWAGAAYDNASQRPTIALQLYAENGTTLLGSATIKDVAGASGWVQALATVNTGANSKIIAKLKNLSVQSVGNDFAIDDFSVKALALPCMMGDLGDAPDTGVGVGMGNYRTTLADNGPGHLVMNDLWLGTVAPDTEGDGYHSGATGDDTNGVDDEDAIAVLPALTVGDTTYSLSDIPVTNATGKSAYLYGWVDVNLNGRFDGNEVATATVANGATTASLNWSGLSGVTVGSSYVRLRLTTQTLANTNSGTPANEDTRSYGLASDGEVEDYALAIKANPVSCVTTTAYLNYCNGSWSGQFDDQLRTCYFSNGSGSRILDYLNGLSGAATTSYKFTVGNLNPGVSNTLSYTWNTNNGVNPKAQTARLYINGVFKDSYTTVAGASPSGPGATDFRNKVVSFVPSGTTANVMVTYSVPGGNMVGSDAVISKLDLNGSYGSTVCTSYDYSDAPVSYGDPRHLIVSGMQLGATVTPDSGAYQSANADGDTDDGISLPSLHQGQQAVLSVSVAGAGGYLQGWIDWNGDGDFADTGEQVAVNIQDNKANDANNAVGTIGVVVNVPATAASTETFARFRWSSIAGLNAVTEASDGEVEDYALTITHPVGSRLSGTVYEDINYGGGAGRSLSGSSGVGVKAATVELYDSSGKWLDSTTTAADGSYEFTAVADGSYVVRVVNDTVRSGRTGSDGSEWPVMTYRSDGVTSTTSQIGGNQPAKQDAGVNSGTAVLGSSFSFIGGSLDGGYAQSTQPVVMSGAGKQSVDFGFNFNTVVNTNDNGQGSLRQFILNSNLLGGESLLAQAGRVAGKESSVFVVPANDPGYRNPDGAANTGDEYWRIRLLTGLPEVLGEDTVLDAVSMPGAECSPLGRRLKVELEGSLVAPASHALTLNGARSEVRGFAIGSTSGNTFGTGIYLYDADPGNPLPGGGATVSCNNIGVDPLGVAYPVAISAAAVHIETDNVTVGGSAPGARNMIGNTGIVSLGTNTSVINNTFGLAGNGETVIPGSGELLRFGQEGALAENNVFAGGGTPVVLSHGAAFRNNLVGFTVSGAQPAGVGAAGAAVTVQGGVATTPVSISGNSMGNAGGAGISFWGNVNVPVSISGNRIGVAPDDTTPAGNAGDGINLANMSSGSVLVGGAGQGNRIAHNGGAGVTYSGSGRVTISANSLHDNAGLGIDLMNDGVTPNDPGDVDSGPNGLLNYPEMSSGSFGTNGSKILAYDFDLDVPANTDGYRIEFFMNTANDPSGHGEGAIYLGYDDISSVGSGVQNFKGLFNANQALPETALISATLTEKLGPAVLGGTSEFSGVKSGSTTSVCTDLLVDPTAALPEIQINENAVLITLLEARDALGEPITYVISGGVDGNMFTIEGPEPGALFDCPRLVFRKTTSVVVTRALPTTRAASSPPVGDFEYPADSGKDNRYDVTISAQDSQGNTVTKSLRAVVNNVNEPPVITSAPTVSVVEGSTGVVQKITAYDPDTADSGQLVFALSGTDAKRFRLDTQTGELRFALPPDFEQPLDANRDNQYQLTVTVADSAGYTGSISLTVSVTNVEELAGMAVRVLLQGAYDRNSGLMSDSLRTLGLLPVAQPYGGAPFSHAGSEQINLDLLGITGANATVDWVLLELRSADDFTQRVAAKAVLVQRDGDLMEAATGSTLLYFAGVAPGSYLVSVRHRNHLGVVTATPVSLSDSNTQVDFSAMTTAVRGEHARLESDALALLLAGDVLHDERLMANGAGNDMNPILAAVLSSPDNTGFNGSYRLAGYSPFDLNMDGVTLFMGPGSDVNLLLGNVLLHPANTGYAGNYVVQGGMR